MASKSKPLLPMEGEELVAAAAAAGHGHAQQHQNKVMRTDKFPFRVPTGPTLDPDQSGSSTSGRWSGAATDLYLYGGAPAPALSAATATTTPTTTTSIPTPASTTIATSPAAAAAAALQPFPAPPSPNPATFKSPGMAATAAAATFRFPFTTAQWQELERQAMIFKYMMAAVPIPPDLLLPSKSCFHHDSSSPTMGRGSTFNLRFSHSVDPEPGRCRRTDGKKWRCSRDVAPDQKYCERHMHRGRPRSRKHVEVQARAAQSLPSTPTPTATTATATITSPDPQLQSFPATQSSFLATKNPFFTHVEQPPRYVDWMNGAGWQFVEQEVGARMRPCYEDRLSLNFSGFGGGSSVGHERSEQCCIFFNSDLSSVEDPLQKDPPLHFIDAWSISTAAEPATTTTTATTSVNTGSEAEISAECKFPMSSLTLSMTSCEEEQVHMGLGVPESDRESVDGEKIAALSWASAPTPLLGGPLGEVLQSTTSAGSNSLSPHSCGSLNLMVEPCVEGCTPTTHDSPTGVLHRTLASLSDSSGCSSPTFAAGQFAFLN